MALYSGGDAGESSPSEKTKIRDKNPGLDVVLMSGAYDHSHKIIKENSVIIDDGIAVLWTLKDGA